MKVETDKSIYREAPGATDEFDLNELRFLRQLLRMLQYREHQVDTGAITDSGALLFAELERDSLAWVLNEVGFLEQR